MPIEFTKTAAASILADVASIAFAQQPAQPPAQSGDTSSDASRAAPPASPGAGPGMMGRSRAYGPGSRSYGPGYPMHPGMMGGYGPGYGPGYGGGPGWGGGPEGYGPGAGWGPGMMGGWGAPGMGPGMMGGWGGWGPGAGMMGYGFGPGMMGGLPGMGVGRALWALDLDDAQRKKLAELQQAQRAKHWDLVGKMQQEMGRMHEAWSGSGGKRDRAAILAAYKRIAELHQQQLENALDAADRLDEILTPEQRAQLESWGRW